MISEESSEVLLKRLKTRLKKDGVIIIGAYTENKKTDKRKMADEVLKDKLNFTFAYPFFKDFAKCGYKYKKIKLDNEDYFILKI